VNNILKDSRSLEGLVGDSEDRRGSNLEGREGKGFVLLHYLFVVVLLLDLLLEAGFGLLLPHDGCDHHVLGDLEPLLVVVYRELPPDPVQFSHQLPLHFVLEVIVLGFQFLPVLFDLAFIVFFEVVLLLAQVD